MLCGVSKSTVGRLLNKIDLFQKEDSEPLKAFTDNSLYLLQNFNKNGGSVKILRSSVCAAIIQHYAFAGKKQAQAALMKFAAIGIDTWVQGITGWQNPIRAHHESKALPGSWMSAELTPDTDEYQLLKAVAQREFRTYGLN